MGSAAHPRCRAASGGWSGDGIASACVGDVSRLHPLRECLGSNAADTAAPPAGAPPAAANPPPAAQSGSTALPTIQVTAPHSKPRLTRTKPAQAATPSATTSAPASPYQTGAPNIAGGAPAVPQLASQMIFSGADLNARPVARPGEILEAAPGLAVVDHADGGKANQYYLRGYNLDHGTDMATYVDDVPINLPTHAHGQGYTDLNWLIPETVSGLEVRKGPYFADVGDFASAGDLHVSLRDSVPQNYRVDDRRQLRLRQISHFGLDQGRRRLAALCRRIRCL